MDSSSSFPRSFQGLQALDVGAQSDRSTIIGMAVLFNCVVGVAFLLSTFFQSYSAGMGFHATTTAMLHLAFCVGLNQWLKRPDPSKIDIFGGMAICIDLMLLQTTILWSALAGGIIGGVGGTSPQPCLVEGGGGDRATAAFAGILLTSQLGTQALAYLWRGDWLGASGMGGYNPIQSSEVPPPATTRKVAQATGAGQRDAFLEADAEVGRL